MPEAQPDLLLNGSEIVDMIKGLTTLGVSFKYVAARPGQSAVVTIELHDEDLVEGEEPTAVIATISSVSVGSFECTCDDQVCTVQGEEALAAWIDQFFADH